MRPTSVLLLALVPHVVCAQGAPAGNLGWYNGDCQSGIRGRANTYIGPHQFARTYDDFVVPAGGWNVTGVFAHSVMAISDMRLAAWEIRSGVATGKGGKVVASGVTPATQTLMFRYPDGTAVYRVQVDGLNVKLPAGTYWLSVAPVASFSESDVCATRGAHAAGSPAGNDGQAFYSSAGAAGEVKFQPVQSTGGAGTSGDFSQGVIIAAAQP